MMLKDVVDVMSTKEWLNFIELKMRSFIWWDIPFKQYKHLKGQCHQECARVRLTDVLIRTRLADSKWFENFLSFCCIVTIKKKDYLQQVKNRGEIAMQQCTPEVQESPWYLKYSANEIIRI
jgi:hypothetical protein